MKTQDFFYALPPELIAQTPARRRDGSRLMTLDRETGTVGHHSFYELPEFLHPGDCLILNDSRVLPARLLGQRLPGGGACEVLLLRQRGEDVWECLARPGRKLRPGTRMLFTESGAGKSDGGESGEEPGGGRSGGVTMEAEVTGVTQDGNRLVRFSCDGVFWETLERIGRLPLPPYIRQEPPEPERYQTVYAKVNGSAAAPTAGLHFTPELLEAIRRKGVGVGFVTLHVGLGTFRPVREEEVTDHKMHEEFCSVPPETAELVNRTRAAGGRCVCVGTTTCRTLESCAAEDGVLRAGSGWTRIFIYPGYRFRATDALLTNFHLPESTLLMLVSAFAGRERVLAAYREAVERRYRFFSFGDAMLLF